MNRKYWYWVVLRSMAKNRYIGAYLLSAHNSTEAHYLALLRTPRQLGKENHSFITLLPENLTIEDADWADRRLRLPEGPRVAKLINSQIKKQKGENHGRYHTFSRS